LFPSGLRTFPYEDQPMTGSVFRFDLPVAAMCALSLFSVAAVAADGPIASPEPDWPQWRGRFRNGISDETGLMQRWPAEGPKLLPAEWDQAVG
ncbi:MAG: hypothetical protein HGB17_13510, partial [Syntrophobacteraceae bacterium]|nr:hypothetical protein [Syntrophobacteraceae bacterium]